MIKHNRKEFNNQILDNIEMNMDNLTIFQAQDLFNEYLDKNNLLIKGSYEDVQRLSNGCFDAEYEGKMYILEDGNGWSRQ